MPVQGGIITTIIMTRITSMDDEQGEMTEVIARLPADISCAEAQAGNALQSREAATQLLVWLSPSFPVGSFAFSHGIEWAVEVGSIRDASSGIDWIGGLMDYGAIRNDAIFAACAWRAASQEDGDALRCVAELALAMAGSRERYLETTAQGNAFATMIREAWACPNFIRSCAQLTGDLAYPVAVGTAAAGHNIPLDAMLRSFAVAAIQNLVSAAIRLSVIGHTDGQRIIAALLPKAMALGREAESALLEDIGGAAFQSDLSALKHETQYTRLFRS